MSRFDGLDDISRSSLDVSETTQTNYVSPTLELLSSMFPQHHIPIPPSSTLLLFSSPTSPSNLTLGLAVNFPHGFPYKPFNREDTHVVTFDGFDFVFELHTSSYFADTLREALKGHMERGGNQGKESGRTQQWESRSGTVEGVRSVFLDSVNSGFRETGCVDIAEGFGEVGKWVRRGGTAKDDDKEGIVGVEEKEDEEREGEEEGGEGGDKSGVEDFTFGDDDDDEGEKMEDESDDEGAEDGSRYSQDFKEIKILGSGGGGSVWKVRNRLDRRLYAIKKIILLPNTNRSAKLINQKLKEEVSMLAGMEGRWVVRYYQGWVEGGKVEYGEGNSGSQHFYLGDGVEGEDVDSGEEDDESRSGWWKSRTTRTAGESEDDASWGSGGSGVLREGHLEHLNAPPQSPLVPAGLNHDIDAMLDIYEDENGEDDDDITNNDKITVTPSTLYIQMEYCPRTVKDVMKEGKLAIREDGSVPPLAVRVFRQVLEGLKYIHRRGVIHRDLKPLNVFLDGEGEVRIGDFGLATEVKKGGKDGRQGPAAASPAVNTATSDSVSSSNPTNSSSAFMSQQTSQQTTSNWSSSTSAASSALTTGVGTAFYRAPEQEHSNTNQSSASSSYGSPADMYSFGVMLFECLNNEWQTGMERAQEMGRLRGEGAVGAVWGVKRRNSVEDREPLDNDRGMGEIKRIWRDEAKKRFSDVFRTKCPERWQRVILWCLQENPKFRPTAEDLLNGDDVPQGPQSKSSMQALVETVGGHGSGSYGFLMGELFNRGNPGWVERRWGEGGVGKDGGIRGLRMRLKRLGVDKGGLPFHGIIGPSLISNIVNGLDFYNPQPMLKAPQSMRVSQANACVGLSVCEGIAGTVGNALSSSPGTAQDDPRLVAWVREKVTAVFQKAGAAEIGTPIFSPSESGLKTSHEVLDREGTVLEARGDLLKGFARCVARAGAVGAIRRYDVSTIYQKAAKGGGPVERLNAEYSVVMDSDGKAETIGNREAVAEVECLLVAEDVMRAIGEGWIAEWVIEVGNARLEELILDLMGFEGTEIRHKVAGIVADLTKMKKKGKGIWEEKNRLLEGIRGLVGEEVLGRLRLFLSPQLMPLAVNPVEAVDSIMQSAKQVAQNMDSTATKPEVRKSQRLMNAISEQVMGTKHSLELYAENRVVGKGGSILFEIGGGSWRGMGFNGLCWSAWIYGINKTGIKVAEGGRFDELVRRTRPPGNFGTSLTNEYTTARIPICAGARFHLDDVLLAMRKWALMERSKSGDVVAQNGAVLQTIRVSLGHPLPLMQHVAKTNLPQVLVCSTGGMEEDTLVERCSVAWGLRKGGVRAEYQSQVGGLCIMKDASIEDISTVCGVMHVPILVVIKMKDYKNGYVKVKNLLLGSDEDVETRNLLPVVLDALDGAGGAAKGGGEEIQGGGLVGVGGEVGVGELDKNMTCFFVGQDGYHAERSRDLGGGKQIKVGRSVMKTLSTARSNVKNRLRSMMVDDRGQFALFVCDLGIWELRELGTGVTLFGMDKFEKVQEALVCKFGGEHKRIWKNFRSGVRDALQTSPRISTLLLYSNETAIFDVVHLDGGGDEESAKAWEKGMKAGGEEVEEVGGGGGGGKKGKGRR